MADYQNLKCYGPGVFSGDLFLLPGWEVWSCGECYPACGYLSGTMRSGIGGVLELTEAAGWLGHWTLLWSDSSRRRGECKPCRSPGPLTQRELQICLHYLAEFWGWIFSTLVVPLNVAFFPPLCPGTEECAAVRSVLFPL